MGRTPLDRPRAASPATRGQQRPPRTEGRAVRLAVIGANGRTGTQVVEQALRRGHTVTAVARRPRPENATTHPGLQTVAADVHRADQISDALAHADAVISAIGIGTSRQPTTAYSDGVTNLLSGMVEHHITRIAVVSAGAAGPRTEQPLLNRLVVLPVLERIFGASYADMRRMEAILGRSDHDWVALRPPRLTTGPARVDYRIDNRPLPRGRSITITDLATALLDLTENSTGHHRGVYIAN